MKYLQIETMKMMVILYPRKKPHALITDPDEAKKHVLSMVKNQALNCHSGKQIPCGDRLCMYTW